MNKLNIQDSDGCVINLAGSTNEKDDVFFIGGIDHFVDSDPGGLNCCDFLKSYGFSGSFSVCDVINESEQGGLSNSGKTRVFLLNSSNATSGKHMLSVRYGVIDEKLISFGDVFNQVALDHSGPLVVCEGPKTATAVIRAMANV